MRKAFRKLYVKIRRTFIPLELCILFCLREMAIVQHIAYAHQIVSNEAIGKRVVEYSVIRCPYPKRRGPETCGPGQDGKGGPLFGQRVASDP